MSVYGKRSGALAPIDAIHHKQQNDGVHKLTTDGLGFFGRKRVDALTRQRIENAVIEVNARRVERASEIALTETDNAAELYKASRNKAHQEAMQNHRLDLVESTVKAKDMVSEVKIKIAHNITQFVEVESANIEGAQISADGREYLRQVLQEEVQEKADLLDLLVRKSNKAIRRSAERHFLDEDK